MVAQAAVTDVLKTMVQPVMVRNLAGKIALCRDVLKYLNIFILHHYVYRVRS